ncbi:MAG: GatB/YqeY domain-containing protein [Flavobacteriaceae bacterium]
MLREEINQALNLATKAQEKRRMQTLRLISAALKDRDIAARTAGKDKVGDDDIRLMMQKMIKQREESAQIYEEAGRLELAGQEREEIEIIRSFLPKQMSDEEIAAVCKGVVSEVGATGLRDMGKCMGMIKSRYPGQMDFSRANQLIKNLIG